MKEVSTISKRKSRSRPQNRRQQPRPVNKGYGDAGASWHKKATKGFRAMSGSPKEDIDANNYTLRQRARMLYMAAPIATSAIRTNRTNVVGIGLQLKSRIDREALGMTQEAADAWQAQAEREFALWSENKRACDATGVNNFAAMQQLALSSWLVSGDVFAVVKQYEPTPLTPYSLRLHLIEADRVATPTTSGIITPMLLTTGKAANGNTIYDGVEVNDDGQIEAYHIRSTYPFELGSTTTTWARVQAYGERTGLPNILHVMESERPDQYRGVSYLAQVIEPLLQLRRYTESELTAAVVESFFTAFIKTEAGAGDNPFNEVGSSLPEVSRDPNEYEMGPGQINIMEPGEDVTFADPKRPASGFNTFLRAICEQVGAALEIPADLLLKSFNSSYSASRAALMEAWKAFRMRRKWFVDDFCTPVYEIWLSEAVARGRISAPGFFADPAIRAAYLGAEWIGPSQGQLDPTKEITAEILAIGEGITTREQATIRLNGGQWDANVDQLRSMMTRETWMVGQEAIDNGFADTLLTDEGPDVTLSADKKVLLVAGIRHDVKGFRHIPGTIPIDNSIHAAPAAGNKHAAAKNDGPKKEDNKTMTLEEMRAQHPDVVAQIEQQAAETARTQERARIEAIDSIAASVGDAQLVRDAKYGETPCTAEQLALKAMQKQAALGAKHLKDAKADNDESGAAGVGAAPNGGEEGSENDDKAKVDAIVGLYNSTKSQNGGKK